MLELQMGLNRDYRRERTMRMMKEACEKGDAKRIYLLVPEQSTFNMGREVCRMIGNDVANGRIEVVGYDRLMRLVYRDCGGRKKHMDEGGRLLAMAQAAEETRKALTVYKSSAMRPEFLQNLLDTYSSCALNGITTEQLTGIAETTESPMLKSKLTDLTNIFTMYQAICAASESDPSEEMDSIVEILLNSDFLNGTYWFIEGFSDFPEQQMRLIQAIIGGAAFVQVSLAAAGLSDDHPGRAISARTGNKLVEFAGRANIDSEIVRTKDESDEHPALSVIQERLCDNLPITEPVPVKGAEKVVRLFTDYTPHQEIQHIAGTILKSIRNGYRYRDISIVLCDYERYAPVVETVCRRYDIPVYMDSEKTDIGKKPVMVAVFSALEAVTRGMPMESVLQYLKSGMSNLPTEEADKLENYVRIWNLHSYDWAPAEPGWDMPPSGIGVDLTEEDAELLVELNGYRRTAINPLLTLKKALEDGTTISDYILALYNFLEEIGYTDHLQTVVDRLMETGEEQLAKEYAQVSEVLAHAMEQMYDVVGSMERSAQDFVKMLKLVCTAYKIATIPVSVDQVEVLSLADARYVCSKVRYIVGCEEGVFPRYAAEAGLLDAAEVKELNDNEIPFPGSLEDTTMRSINDIDTVVSGAKRILCMSYASEPSEPTTPSYLLERVHQLFPAVEPTRGCGENRIYDADLMTAETAGKMLGRISNRAAYEQVALSLALVDNEHMQQTACRVLDKAGWALGDLSRASIKGLYGERIPLSATRADVYAACRYHYFLKYGLALRERPKGRADAPFFGKFAHFVLEKSLREIEAKGGFDTIDKATLRDITQKHIDKYIETKMPHLESQPERYQFLMKRQCREVITILRNVCAEFAVSDFRPCEFEYKFGGEDADTAAISIEGEQAKGTYTGIADRVDIGIVNGKPYTRIVDYKTGRSKTMDYADLLMGMSMQLILYQAALQKNGYRGGTERAGAVFIPAKDSIVATPTKVSDEKVQAEYDKMQARHGILLDDKDVINAMEHIDGKAGKFIAVKFAADGTMTGELATAEELELLDKYAMHKMGEMVDEISEGKVTANPISRGPENTSCTYCPMQAACHKDACGIKFRYRKQTSYEECMDKIRGTLHIPPAEPKKSKK